MIISLIAAMAENRVIGREDSLPWHLPTDMRRFKRLTTGHSVVMGRKTYDTLSGPLPQRRNLVITRNASYEAAGAEVFHSLQDAMAAVAGDDEVFIAGGEAIYCLALPHADRIYLTVVHAVIPGDTYFPEFHMDEWCLEEDLRHHADERHAYPFSFRRYTRLTKGT